MKVITVIIVFNIGGFTLWRVAVHEGTFSVLNVLVNPLECKQLRICDCVHIIADGVLWAAFVEQIFEAGKSK